MSADAFWDHVTKTEACWTWSGTLSHGYGRHRLAGRTIAAHRYSYELANGPIPSGMVVDHLCHITECVNPAHLRAVPQKLNMENRKGAQARNKSGVRGVYWNKAEGKWQAQVVHNYKTHYAGRFDDLTEAAEAVEALRLSLYGGKAA